MAKFALLSMVSPALCLVDDPHWPSFEKFMKDFDRSYSSVGELEGRFAIFKENLKLIDERNAKGTTMKHGITMHADLTPEQFRAQRLGRTEAGSWSAMGRKPAFDLSWETVRASTDSVDWCAQGACTPIKDQGRCGSCWAFGGTEMLESDYYIRFGTLYELSTQEPTSCDFYDGGCAGGNAVNEWAWVNSIGGIASADVYPYDSGVTQCSGVCETALEASEYMKVGVNGSFWFSLSAEDEGNMLLDIPLTPISVAVDANSWSSYTGGIVTPDDCGTDLDHNVQVTGYNAEGNYWIVRNSWGTAWGNDGFIYVAAGNNTCGIALEAAGVVTSAPTAAAKLV